MYKVTEFDLKQDNRGSLIALEVNREIPFNINRVFYIYDIKKGEKRGHHAHKKSRQMIICLDGSCKLSLEDGKSKKEIILDSPDRGLLVDKGIWLDIYDFSEKAILMVICDSLYREEDYIRDYESFLKYKTAEGEEVYD